MLPPQHKHLTNFIIRLPALEFLYFDKCLPLSELHILTLFTTMKLTSILWKILTYAIFFGLYHWGFCFSPSEKKIHVKPGTLVLFYPQSLIRDCINIKYLYTDRNSLLDCSTGGNKTHK